MGFLKKLLGAVATGGVSPAASKKGRKALGAGLTGGASLLGGFMKGNRRRRQGLGQPGPAQQPGMGGMPLGQFALQALQQAGGGNTLAKPMPPGTDPGMAMQAPLSPMQPPPSPLMGPQPAQAMPQPGLPPQQPSPEELMEKRLMGRQF